MSASKKSSKTIKSPAPATKTAVSKAPAKKKSGAVTIKSDTTSPVLIQSSLPITTPAAAPAVVKAVPIKPVTTTISARVDVGFGNALFLRGEGPGLSWDQGIAMENVGADLWRVTLAESARPFTFKFLINDVTWSTGPDFTAASGSSATLTPEF